MATATAFHWSRAAAVLVVLLGTAGCARTAPLSTGPNAASAADVTIRVDPSRASAWAVDPRILGRFFEHNGRDAYPGLFAQHLGNGSFEDWYTTRRGSRTEELYPTDPHPGLAFLWEPAWRGHGPVFWDRLDGGPHGESYQRITIGIPDAAGIRQRVALPDARTLAYDLSLWARGEGIALLTATLRDSSHVVAARHEITLGPQWERHAVRLTLPAATADRFRSSPFGEYVLELTAVAPGAGAPFIELDGVMLMAGDAVEGKYNPTTLRWLREFGVPSLRWPGGNWASAYRWQDGVGPVEQRPIRPNTAWGGLEPNYFGTNEFLEFARLAGIDPLINVAFNREIPPAEAGRWVEYVNGDTTTEMGRLRARHGYPEPWHVRLWQVGNESYGTYQIGHVPAPEYARGIREYVDAMKAADPGITVIVAGADPGYVDWNAEEWNNTLFEIAGDRVDAIDIHRYLTGIRDPREREAEWEPLEYLQTHMVFPTQFEVLLRELRADARERGVADLEISVGEWNAGPRVSEGWPSMAYPTMAHAAFVASMYNTFIRQGDAVRYAYQRDNTLWFRPYDGDFRPLNPGAHTLRLYADVLDDGASHHVPLDVRGPTLDTRRIGRRVRPMSGVPYVDAAGLLSANGDSVILFLTNRDLSRPHTVEVRLSPGWRLRGPGKSTVQWSEDPVAHQTSWGAPNSFRIDEAAVQPAGDGSVRVALPAAAVLRLQLSIERSHR